MVAPRHEHDLQRARPVEVAHLHRHRSLYPRRTRLLRRLGGEKFAVSLGLLGELHAQHRRLGVERLQLFAALGAGGGQLRLNRRQLVCKESPGGA